MRWRNSTKKKLWKPKKVSVLCDHFVMRGSVNILKSLHFGRCKTQQAWCNHVKNNKTTESDPRREWKNVHSTRYNSIGRNILNIYGAQLHRCLSHLIQSSRLRMAIKNNIYFDTLHDLGLLLNWASAMDREFCRETFPHHLATQL